MLLARIYQAITGIAPPTHESVEYSVQFDNRIRVVSI